MCRTASHVTPRVAEAPIGTLSLRSVIRFASLPALRGQTPGGMRGRHGRNVVVAPASTFRGAPIHPQPAVGPDPDHDLARLRCALGQQRVQLPDPSQPLRHAPLREPLAVLVEHAHVVVGLSPVIPDEESPAQLVDPPQRVREEPQRPGGSVLAARHPTSHTLSSSTGGARATARGATSGRNGAHPPATRDQPDEPAGLIDTHQTAQRKRRRHRLSGGVLRRACVERRGIAATRDGEPPCSLAAEQRHAVRRRMPRPGDWKSAPGEFRVHGPSPPEGRPETTATRTAHPGNLPEP